MLPLRHTAMPPVDGSAYCGWAEQVWPSSKAWRGGGGWSTARRAEAPCAEFDSCIHRRLVNVGWWWWRRGKAGAMHAHMLLSAEETKEI